MKSTSTQSNLKKHLYRLVASIKNAGYLFTPFIAMVVFALAMGLILWSLNNQEKNQQNLVLFRELAFAKQRIEINFSENEEQLLSISKLISSSEKNQVYPQEFIQEASNLVSKHPEIIQIKWLNNESRIWIYPIIKSKDDWITRFTVKETLDQELEKTLVQAKETSHAQYSEIFEIDPATSNSSFNKERRWVFWYVLPSSRSEENQGNIAVLYAAKNILSEIIPKDLTSRHLFSIVNAEGNQIVGTSDRNLPRNTIRHQVSLDKLLGNLYLQGESYPVPSNLGYRMLLWLVIGLCLFVIWSLWSVWRQMKSRQEIEKNLIDETNFRRTIEDSMPIGIRVHDLDAKITYVNPAFCRMVGWSSDELVGLAPPYPFWPDKDLPQIMNKLKTAMATNETPKNGFEATINTKSGQMVSVRTFISPLIDSKGTQRGWVSSAVDISEPKRIREELAASHQRFTTVLEGLDAAVSVVNPKNGELLFANGLYKERFGANADGHIKLIGGEMQPDDADLLDQDSVDAFAGLPASALTPISGDAIEVLVPEQNVWYEVRRRYLPWTDGHLAQLIIATDITPRHLAEEQARLQEEKMQFTRRLTTMGEMASSLAHELNQPLAAINNYCMGVISRLKTKNDPTLNAEIIPALEKAGNQAIRAGSIIQRIRSFVKRSAPQRQQCSLHEIIDDAVELVKIEAKRQSLDIQTHFAKDLPECFVDPVLIQQVLVNLLKNALDSMRDSIPTNLRYLAPSIEVIVDIQTNNHPAMLRIRIIDGGKGIPENVKAQIYEPFFSTKSDGMGMGLNICRSIIESHEGRLWAENGTLIANAPESDNEIKPQLSGCTFTILLPMEKYAQTDSYSKDDLNLNAPQA